MLSIYVKLSNHVLDIQAREPAINMQGTVIALARLKIVPTIKNLICRYLVYDCGM